MGSKGITNALLVWRILALLSLIASVVVMVTNDFNIAGFKTKFTEVHTYRYVVATASVAGLYILIQMPFNIYQSCTEKRFIKGGFLPGFDFTGDKVMSFLLATGAGGGFFVTYEALDSIKGIEGIGDFRTFLYRAYISNGLLFLGFISMAISSVFSSIALSTTTSSSGKGGFFFFR